MPHPEAVPTFRRSSRKHGWSLDTTQDFLLAWRSEPLPRLFLFQAREGGHLYAVREEEGMTFGEFLTEPQALLLYRQLPLKHPWR